MIYFAQCAKTGLVKIGRSGNPEQRIAAMQAGSPTRLRLAGVIPGGSKEEVLLHRRYKHKRVHGEWFRLSASVLNFCLSQTEGMNMTPPKRIDVGRIGLRVRELRLRAGLTQARLGELAGAHANTITQLEVGGLDNISVSKLDSIATILGERLDVLIRRAKAVT